MPSMLFHLAFAERVGFNLLGQFYIERKDFLAGNLIPNLSIAKEQAHYITPSANKFFNLPDIEKATKDLLHAENSILLGIYCHLYLDYHFINDFIISKFVWDEVKETIYNPITNKSWDAKTFFSEKGLYGAYDEIDRLLITSKCIPFYLISALPNDLPNTGISVYDNRILESWRTELDKKIRNNSSYTGEIIDYNTLNDFFDVLSSKLCKELLKYKRQNM